MAITSPKMGSGNRAYPYKRKLKPGTPPAKMAEGGVIEETPEKRYARYVATYGVDEAKRKIQAELKSKVDSNISNTSFNKQKYEPSQSVKNTKAALSVASIATSGNPLISYLPSVAGSVYDFGTSARYAMDGNKDMAKEDFLQGLLGLIPGLRGTGIGLKGERTLRTGERVINDVLKTGQKISDVDQIQGVFAEGGTVPDVDPLDQEVLDWTKSYVGSSKYKQRLGNFYKYPDVIQRKRSEVIDATKFNPVTPSTRALAYYSSGNDISVGPLGVKDVQTVNPKANPNLVRQQIVAHELGHATNTGEAPGSQLSTSEQNYILGRNKNITSEQRQTIQQGLQEGKRFSGSSLHDLLPSESKSDIDATRFLLNKAGIYDARTQDITPELLQKAKQNKALQTSPVFKRLQENFSDDALLDILNKVAINTPQTDITYAEDGGKIPKYVAPNVNKIKNPVLTDDLTYQISVPDESVRDWHISYINSPKYRERLIKMGYSNPDKVIKDRTKRLKDTNIISSDKEIDLGSYYDQMNGANTIYMDYPQIKRLNTSRDDILAHEMSHVNNSSTNIRRDKKGNLFVSPTNTSLNENEEEYIANRNINVGNKILDIFRKSPAKKNNTYSNVLGGIDHDYSPSENKSDIDALRYILQKEGIYKAGSEDFTPEILEKAKNNKAIQRLYNASRVFKKFNDKDIIDIMNNIAYNNENNKPMIAKKGGLSRAEDYGSKKKPYPSVSKGDFAGGGRSYPIPTRADAIDALRLAGLHGRSDVRAKVFKKYPDLKKEFGGEIFAHDANKVQNIWYPKLKAELGVEVPEGYHQMSDGTIMADDVMIPEAKKGIYIKPENRGKFNATKKRTGKSTEELTHSKNPKTRKRAIFAQNAAKWRKGKYGLEIYDEGGLIDPNDPMFAQQIQDLIRNNPELAKDILSPSISSTPPSAGQEITGLQPLDGAPTVNGPSNVNTNTNAQQNKPNSNRPKVNIPSINFGDAISMGVQGLDLLATEYIDAPRKRANEMRLLRQQLTPVISKPSSGGYDMPILAKSGIQITSAYTDPVGLPAATKAKNPFGNVGNNFKVDNPEFANVLAEGGEFLELPNGQTSTITGDKHSDYSGGEFMSLPEGAKIYSDSIKVDKTFQKDLTGSGSGKKKTVAQIAKKFNTDHEEGILKDPTADNISKRSANIMKTFKQSQLQQLFDYQESVKDPMYMINKDQSANDYLGSEDTVVAKKGVKVMADGGEPPKRKRRSFEPLDSNNIRKEILVNNSLPNNSPWWNNIGTQGSVSPLRPGVGNSNMWWNNPSDNLTTNGEGVNGVAEIDNTLPNEQPWWQNLSTGRNTLLPMGTGVSRQKYTTPDSTPTTPISTPVSTPNSTPEINTLSPVRMNLPELSLEGVTPPELQTAVPPTTIVPGSTPIDPSKPRKPMPDNNKENPPRPNPRTPWSNTLNGFGEIVPELTALIQNETDFPVFTARYQPRYLNPVELNIQASLNRNYAQTAPLLEGNSGNPSIDNARAAQALANLYDANNEAFQQKFNFDTQNRYQTDATNLQIENQANLYNLQRADDYWNKITARQAVKEATRNNIMNSAYSKFKRKQLESRSLQLTNQMFDNFKYDPERGVYFTPSGEQYIFHEPSGNFINIGSTPGDGVETTRTVRNTPKGTTTTLRQKEKKGS